MKIKEFTNLQTERMHLKPLVATFELAKHLFDIISQNQTFFQYLPWSKIENAEQEFDFLRGAENNWKNKTKATYGMFSRDTGEFIGVCTVFNISCFDESCEIGYWLNPKYANQGFMSEAVKVISNEFFNMGFKRIVIKANPKNVASCKTAEKCGFEQEGILRSYDFLPALNEREDIVLYAKIKEK